jgi:hypothetical protein
MSIHYLKHAEIDLKAWDNCITGSFNGTLHAWSWYLNLCCREWDALVEDDYTSVMPLIIGKHWGHKIIVLSGFARPLGIFSKEPINAAKTQAFVDAIPEHFLYYRILLNKYNPVELPREAVLLRNNYELDLIKPYYRLVSDFNSALRFKLNLAMTHHFTVNKGLTQKDLMGFMSSHPIRPGKKISANNYLLLRMLITGILRHKSGEVFGLYNRHSQLTAVALFSWFNNRIHLEFLASDPAQEKAYPQLFLIDRFIEKYAETNSTLSFEYPVEPANPNQFTDFNARESHVIEIRHNRLPFYMKILSWRKPL